MATKREIAVTPGSGDGVGVVDTDAKDASGNLITAQAVAALGPSGTTAEVYDEVGHGALSVDTPTLGYLQSIDGQLRELLVILKLAIGQN